MFRVLLGRVAVVLGRVQRVAVRGVRMVGGLFVISALGVLRRFAMMLRGMLVMLGSLLVMLVNVVCAHGILQDQATV